MYAYLECESSHYDVSVVSMSVMGFQKSLYVCGCGELYPVFLFWIFRIFLTLQRPLVGSLYTQDHRHSPVFKNIQDH